MRIGVPQLALSILVYFYLVPLQACQEPILSNYVVDLEDGEHVFAMKYRPDVGFEYPVSGVYRKGPDKQLVWEYHDGFVNWDRLKNRISANGQYFIRTHFRQEEQVVFLAIFDNGKLIREFDRDTFIDDISQVYQPICSYSFWLLFRYDKQNDQVKIESKAKRVVTIDVPTGEILSVDKVRRMRIDGVITLKNGSEQVIQEIGNCRSIIHGLMIPLRKEDGLTDSLYFIAYENGKEVIIDGSTYFLPDMFKVFLDEVQSMVFDKEDDHGDYPVEIRLTDGAFYQWYVRSGFGVCGKGEEGQSLYFKAGELETLNITLSRPED